MDATDMTCRHWRHLDRVRLLLAHGADPNLADIEGKTPLMLAQENKRPGVVALLRQAGAKK
jgi:ankyrin repeat protein